MNFLLAMLDDAKKVPDTVEELFSMKIWPIVSDVLWILVAVLAVIAVIKGVTTAMAVMKAADEPQVRQEKIGAFKYLAIGLGIAIVIISLANIIVTMILKKAVVDTNLDIPSTSTGGANQTQTPPAAFLF